VAARAEVDGAHAPSLITDAEVYAMIDSLGNVRAAMKDAQSDTLERLGCTASWVWDSATNHRSEHWMSCSRHVWLKDVAEGGVAH
jgi:hypothetical protein